MGVQNKDFVCPVHMLGFPQETVSRCGFSVVCLSGHPILPTQADQQSTGCHQPCLPCAEQLFRGLGDEGHAGGGGGRRDMQEGETSITVFKIVI